jgi:hypothetical protein
LAQSCAMCNSSAAAASKDAQIAISRAVHILLVPPASLMTVGVGMFHDGKKRDLEQVRATTRQQLST